MRLRPPASDSGGRRSVAAVWGWWAAMALAAALATLLICALWHARIANVGDPRLSIPEAQARSEALHDCVSAASTAAEIDACRKAASAELKRYPWPTTHGGWAAVMAFVAVVAAGRVLVWPRFD
jgi:hypothetical protein